MTEQSAETDPIDELVQRVDVAAHAVAIERIGAGQPHAATIHDAVRAAFACALGNGLIQLVPREQWPRGITVHPPYQPPVDRSHLIPNTVTKGFVHVEMTNDVGCGRSWSFGDPEPDVAMGTRVTDRDGTVFELGEQGDEIGWIPVDGPHLAHYANGPHEWDVLRMPLTEAGTGPDQT